MNIDIQSLGFPITGALSDYAKRRLRFVLTRRSDRIQHVVVRLGDENGPRGGIDKFCRIQVYMFDAPMASLGEVGPELYAVIDRATDRVGNVVVKHLERRRTGRRYKRDNVTALVPDEFDAQPFLTHAEDPRPQCPERTQ